MDLVSNNQNKIKINAIVLSLLLIKLSSWAGKMTQWVKVLATQPDDLSLIPEIHMFDGENRLLEVVL